MSQDPISFTLTPSKNNGNFTVVVTSINALPANFVIYNSMGSTVFTKSVSLAEGANTFPIQVPHLSNGVYMFYLHAATYRLSKRFVLVR